MGSRGIADLMGVKIQISCTMVWYILHKKIIREIYQKVYMNSEYRLLLSLCVMSRTKWTAHFSSNSARRNVTEVGTVVEKGAPCI